MYNVYNILKCSLKLLVKPMKTGETSACCA